MNATRWKVILFGTRTKMGTAETTTTETREFETAKAVFAEYVERARKANKKETYGRYNRKRQEKLFGEYDMHFYNEREYNTYYVTLIETDWN